MDATQDRAGTYLILFKYCGVYLVALAGEIYLTNSIHNPELIHKFLCEFVGLFVPNYATTEQQINLISCSDIDENVESEIGFFLSGKLMIPTKFMKNRNSRR